jgi:hypothetical protein
MKFASIQAIYCSANLRPGTFQSRADARLKAGATGIEMLFHWRSAVKTIYSPAVRIIAKSMDKDLAGSTLPWMRSA